MATLIVASPAVPASATAQAPAASLSISKLATPILSSTTKLGREVFGFTYAGSLTDPTVGYPSWNFDLLSTVAFFGLYVNWDGNINTNSSSNVWNSSALTGLVQTAHAHGTKVVVTIVLGDFTAGTRNMCAGLINRAKTIKQTVAQVAAKGVDGVNVDYESNNATCAANGQTNRSMLVQFVHDLRAALPRGKYLSIDTYASSAGDPAGFYDIPGLNPYVDSFFVMAYNLAWSNYRRAPLNCSSMCLGPAAPLTGYYYDDTSIAAQYSAVVPASKVILGVPYYGNVACVASPIANATAITGTTAETYLNASRESSAASTKPGTYAIHRDVNDPTGKTRWDTWYSTSLGCTRELYWDDATSLGAKYAFVNSAGLRGVGIWTLNYGGGAHELWSALATHFAACKSIAVTASPASPQNVGASITLSAHATGCANPVYRFSVIGPGGSNEVGQDYSTSPTFVWKSSGLTPGTYRFSVWARNAESSGVFGNGSGRWDAYNNSLMYTLKSCSQVSVSVTPPSPAGVGATVGVAAHALGCSNPLFRFWVVSPGGSYEIAQDYSTSATFSWNTTGRAPGQYRLAVWARDANSAGTSGNTSGRWDAYNNATLYSLMPVCSSVTASGTPSSPVGAGTLINVTANAAGCPAPLYQFFVLAPGANAFQLVQTYSTKATLSWNSSAKAPGDYRIAVWARDAHSSGLFGNNVGRWDTYNNNTVYKVTPVCSAVTVTVAPASTAKSGTVVSVTARATGCASPLYHFSILSPGATEFRVVQDYSSNSTLTWNTTGAATGTYHISVWARDANSAGTFGNSSGRWDAYNNNTTYLLN